MPLNHIRIESFRCLTRVELYPHAEENYFFGSNGAGKTSLLEAIYLLGRGRSFRLRQTRRLIQHGAGGFSVYGEVVTGGHNHRLGVSVDTAGRKLRLDGHSGPAMAALAQVFPVYVIEPSVHLLIEGGPRERRRFLDWGVFHVEQGYIAAWRRYRRVLGQRNAALRAGQNANSWNAGIVEEGFTVTNARKRYVTELQAALNGLGESLLDRPLEVSYRPGWRADLTLEEALKGSSHRDRSTGATQVGPHRAELVVNLGARGIREEVSRGQQKLAAAALVLAQVRVLAAAKGDGGVLLVDDPAAELDGAALQGLMSVLNSLPAQRIMTGLSRASLPPVHGDAVFHVEQGKILPML